MPGGVLLLVGVTGLLFALAVLGAAAHIYADGGRRVFYWPRLDHGYEVQCATRLAALPWYVLLYLAAVNGLAILLFAHDLTGRPSTAYGFWFAATLVPLVMIHLVDYRRSPAAAFLTLLVVVGSAGWLAYQTLSWVPALVAAPFLLWSLNGLRATIADRTFG